MRSRFGLNRLGFRSRVLVAALLPSVAIALALAVHFTSTRIADIERALIDRAMLLTASLAPASEYGLFAGNIDILQSIADARCASAMSTGWSCSTATTWCWPGQGVRACLNAA